MSNNSRSVINSLSLVFIWSPLKEQGTKQMTLLSRCGAGILDDISSETWPHQLINWAWESDSIYLFEHGNQAQCLSVVQGSASCLLFQQCCYSCGTWVEVRLLPRGSLISSLDCCSIRFCVKSTPNQIPVKSKHVMFLLWASHSSISHVEHANSQIELT